MPLLLTEKEMEEADEAVSWPPLEMPGKMEVEEVDFFRRLQTLGSRQTSSIYTSGYKILVALSRILHTG